MVTLITIIHVLVCLFLILVVLLQAGKGGGMGLAFGSSGAQTVFGGSGAGNLLTRVTAITAALFMLTSLTLAYFASARGSEWFVEAEKENAAVLQRDREARERLAAPAGDAGAAKAVPAEGEPAPTPSEDEAAPESGTATPETGAAPVPAEVPADKPVTPAAPADKPAPTPAAAPAGKKPAAPAGKKPAVPADKKPAAPPAPAPL